MKNLIQIYPDLDLKEIQDNPNLAKKMAKDILNDLEVAGKCRGAYHRLFAVLFNDMESFFDDESNVD